MVFLGPNIPILGALVAVDVFRTWYLFHAKAKESDCFLLADRGYSNYVHTGGFVRSQSDHIHHRHHPFNTSGSDSVRCTEFGLRSMGNLGGKKAIPPLGRSWIGR